MGGMDSGSLETVDKSQFHKFNHILPQVASKGPLKEKTTKPIISQNPKISFFFVIAIPIKGYPSSQSLNIAWSFSGCNKQLLRKTTITSWWFQPTSKIWVKMSSSSPIFGVYIKISCHHLVTGFWWPTLYPP